MSKYNKPISFKKKKSFSKFLSEDEDLKVATGLSSFYLRQRFLIQLIFPWGVLIIVGLGGVYLLKMQLIYGVFLGVFCAALGSFLQTWIINKSHQYLLTTRRVVIKNGFFKIQIASALYDKITHIEVDQEFFERIFLHHGTVIINTAGANQDALILRFVENPIEFKNILEKLIHKRNVFEISTQTESKPFRMLE